MGVSPEAHYQAKTAMNKSPQPVWLSTLLCVAKAENANHARRDRPGGLCNAFAPGLGTDLLPVASNPLAQHLVDARLPARPCGAKMTEHLRRQPDMDVNLGVGFLGRPRAGGC
jgi:hypothetical protein